MIRQLVCRMGHLGMMEDEEDRDEAVVAHIQYCALCGGRADWRRTREEIKKIGTSDQLNPNQR